MAYKKQTECKFCGLSFSEMNTSQVANHTRWCKSNPKYDLYREQSSKIHLGHTEKSRKQQAEKIKELHKNGLYDHVDHAHFRGKTHSDESKLKISESSRKSNHRRLVRSIRQYVKKSGEIIMLDSSWEEELAKRLDFLEVEWIRPDSMHWIDSKGNKRNYFPDFYLPAYDIYLDPKNPAAYNQQIEKVNWLKENIKNLVFLLSLEEILNYSPGSSMD